MVIRYCLVGHLSNFVGSWFCHNRQIVDHYFKSFKYIRAYYRLCPLLVTHDVNMGHGKWVHTLLLANKSSFY
jgi:hypothetical protein